MILNGIKTRASNVYGFRRSVEGDLDLDGRQVESNYFVVVRIDKCVHKFNEERGRTYYHPDEEPLAPQAMPLSYSMTCAGRGPARKQSSCSGRWAFDSKTRKHEYVFEWYRMPYFQAHDGIVYSGGECRTVDSWKKLCRKNKWTLAGVPKDLKKS